MMGYGDAFCYVCYRNTNHIAEHDGLVAAGLAEYGTDDVLRTPAWDDALAREVSAVEYREYSAAFRNGTDPLALDYPAIIAEARANVARA